MNDQQKKSHYHLYKATAATKIWQVKGAPVRSPFFYEAGITIDVDGAADAYAPRGSGLQGRDYLGNALPLKDSQGRAPKSPGWIPTYKSTLRDKTGASVVQKSGPTQGYYIAETSLKDIFCDATDVKRQTDATTYPRGIIYIVFPDTGLGKELRCPLQDLSTNGKRWLDLYDDRLDLVKQVTDCFSPEYPGVAQAFRKLG
jgi:hypothetical protein